MAFKALFLAHAPDGDPSKHHCFIDTGKYQLDVVIVKSQAEALEVSKRLFAEKKIDSILLCPGFTHENIPAPGGCSRREDSGHWSHRIHWRTPGA